MTAEINELRERVMQLERALSDIVRRNHSFFGADASRNPASLYSAVNRGRDLLAAPVTDKKGGEHAD